MKIKVLPQDVEFENDPNKTLLQQCHEQGIHINSLCKGQPKCAECRIKITQGDQNVIPPSAVEIGLLGNNYYLDGRRLSCQVRAFGNLTIDASEQVEREQSAHKKIRGFRPKDRQYQSQAVLDTLILDEKPAPAAAASAPQGEKKSDSSGGQQRNQDRGQDRNQPRNNDRKNDQRGRNSRPSRKDK
jgi:2Fe-2S ferredoxin